MAARNPHPQGGGKGSSREVIFFFCEIFFAGSIRFFCFNRALSVCHCQKESKPDCLGPPLCVVAARPSHGSFHPFDRDAASRRRDLYSVRALFRFSAFSPDICVAPSSSLTDPNNHPLLFFPPPTPTITTPHPACHGSTLPLRRQKIASDCTRS